MWVVMGESQDACKTIVGNLLDVAAEHVAYQSTLKALKLHFF
jgi:hypothetical protein